MRKFLVCLQFYGKNYSGYQKNKNCKTIQQTIESALLKLFELPTTIEGCSRTDTGVSAKEYYFTFVADTKLPAERVAFKLNKFLPNDIQCQASYEVKPDFDLRKNVISKTYQYSIYDGQHMKPLLNRNAMFVKGNVDVKKMQKCAEYLIGQHNFKSFCNVNSDSKTFVRTVYRIEVIRNFEEVKIYITADGFLYNMARIIAGTLVECGLEKMDVEDIKKLFIQMDRTKNVAPTMPAKGLTLYEVQLAV